MFAKKAHVAHDFELNLTPIIDCFVTLICFLLLSTTYVNLVGLDAKVPIAVPTSSTATDDKPKFKLELLVKANGMELNASSAGSLSGKKTIVAHGAKPTDTELAQLHDELVKLKKQFPKEFSISFATHLDMNYEDLVRFMDATRNLTPKDGALTFTDERNGKMVKVDLLFPDFVMEKLYEH